MTKWGFVMNRGKFIFGNTTFTFPKKDFATTILELRKRAYALHIEMGKQEGAVYEELRENRDLLARAADYLQHAEIICRAYARNLSKGDS